MHCGGINYITYLELFSMISNFEISRKSTLDQKRATIQLCICCCAGRVSVWPCAAPQSGSDEEVRSARQASSVCRLWPSDRHQHWSQHNNHQNHRGQHTEQQNHRSQHTEHQNHRSQHTEHWNHRRQHTEHQNHRSHCPMVMVVVAVVVGMVVVQ